MNNNGLVFKNNFVSSFKPPVRAKETRKLIEEKYKFKKGIKNRKQKVKKFRKIQDTEQKWRAWLSEGGKKWCTTCGFLVNVVKINNKSSCRLCNKNLPEFNIAARLKRFNNKPAFMPFGKYKGEELKDIPTYYLQWLFKQAFVQDDLKDKIKRVLN